MPSGQETHWIYSTAPEDHTGPENNLACYWQSVVIDSTFFSESQNTNYEHTDTTRLNYICKYVHIEI